MDARTVIERLGLLRHPEGGWYRETWRADVRTGMRAAGTAIHFLLPAGERSRWHRVTDATELWLFQAGDPLELLVKTQHQPTTSLRLGPDLRAGQRLQGIVPAGAWQAARTLGRLDARQLRGRAGLRVQLLRAGTRGLGTRRPTPRSL